jgi:hypothetical protein
MIWERVINWNDETGLHGEMWGRTDFSVILKSNSRYFAFHENRLLTLKPGCDGLLTELEITQFTPPDAIQALWQMHTDIHNDFLRA